MIGRKNWLFSGQAHAAPPRARCLYSLIETAKANGCEPYWYLRELFEKLPLARTRADYVALLPHCPSIVATAIDTWVYRPLTRFRLTLTLPVGWLVARPVSPAVPSTRASSREISSTSSATSCRSCRCSARRRRSAGTRPPTPANWPPTGALEP